MNGNSFAIALVAAFLTAASPLAVADASSQKNAIRKQVMSHSISTLLTRNLNDVFGENDAARRRAAIDEIFTDDCVFYEPNGGVYRGRDAIDQIAGKIRETHSDFQYQPIAKLEELGNAGRVRWVEGRAGEAPTIAGTDFIIARDGRIAALICFSTSYPELNTEALLGSSRCRLRGPVLQKLAATAHR